MTKLDRITPEGTKDLLFKDCKMRRFVENKLRDLYRLFCYYEVMTPAIEFFDVFSEGVGKVSQNEMYTLTDSSGRLLVLRPDSTKPIARLYASRLQNLRLPLRLFYNQSVYKRNIHYYRKSDESLQIGIELIGGSGFKADAEILGLAAESLKQLFGTNFVIEIGHTSFVREVFSNIKASEQVKEELKAAVLSKNYPAVETLLSEDQEGAERIKNLMRLYGKGNEVLSDASKLFNEKELKEPLCYLSELIQLFNSMGMSDNLLLDLAVVNEFDYYTGLVFKGYAGGLGQEVLSGGRYDTLYGDYGLTIPATGFAVYEDAVSAAMMQKENGEGSRVLVIVHSEKNQEAAAFSCIKKYTNEKQKCELSLCETEQETIAYAKEAGAKKIILIDREGKITEQEIL